MRIPRPAFLFLVALFTVAAGSSGAQGAPNPCSDSLYVVLKQRPVDSLSAREYELFRERDRACLQYTPSNGTARPASSAAPDASAVALAVVEGRDVAEREGTAGWFAGGVGSGLVLGLIGTGIITIVAHNSGSTPPSSQQVILATKPPEYSTAFVKGYQERMRSRKRNAALGGGLLGTAVFVVLYASAQSGS